MDIDIFFIVLGKHLLHVAFFSITDIITYMKAHDILHAMVLDNGDKDTWIEVFRH